MNISTSRRAARVTLVGATVVATAIAAAATAGAAPGSKTGKTTETAPYLVRSVPGVNLTSISTAGDTVGDYLFAGTPDGLGAYDNGDGTFTVLVGHEFTATQGVVRAHGAKGSFVSKLVVSKGSTKVISGEDLDTTFVTTGSQALTRLCSGDLPDRTALYNAATGRGYDGHIFLDGEETTGGRAIAHVVDEKTMYELPSLGKLAWENVLANPGTGDDTVVAGNNDGGTGNVVIYHGTKSSTGSAIQKAGLVGGSLASIAVTGLTTEVSTTSAAGFSAPFTLAATGTSFRRPEDGAWDPANPNVYYFATTAAFGEYSRLWKATFKDASHPELGGTIEVAFEGAGPDTSKGPQMMDNLTITSRGDVLVQEDVGGNDYVGGVYQVDPNTGHSRKVATFDPQLFTPGQPGFITNDEESSGIIPAPFLGEGKYILDAQVHAAYPGVDGAAVVERGQLLLMHIPPGQKF